MQFIQKQNNRTLEIEMIESPRLNFRRVDPSDFDFLLKYLSDPVLTKHLPLGAPYPKDEILSYLDNRVKHWQQHHFGTFLISLKSSPNSIGYCGLEYVKETEFIDIRYGVVRDCWGGGIAKEAAKRCIEFGFIDLRLDTIFGAAEPENIPSLAVLGKIGMKPCAGYNFYGDVVNYFHITKSEYLRGYA